jgi:hypothetical protein
LETVILADDQLEFSIDSVGLRRRLGLTETPRSRRAYSIAIPCRRCRRGRELRFIVANAAAATASPDPTLVRAVVCAHDWWRRWQAGEVCSLRDVVRTDGVSISLVRLHLPLAFLAPDLVEQILTRQQPPDLTTERLVRDGSLPLDWAEQRQLFGK